MVTIIQNPASHSLEEDSFAFYYDPAENVLVTDVFSGPAECSSPYPLVTAPTYKECEDYISNNSINIPEWMQQ